MRTLPTAPRPAPSRRRALATLACLPVVALAVAACGGSSGGDSLVGAQPPPTTTTPAATLTSVPAPGVGRSGPLTVTGSVEAGVEPSCLILKGKTGGSYELMGPLARQLRPEQTVRVTGHVVTGVASHCMQGRPFEITAIVRR